MLKTRIIPTLLCRGRELVKGKRFDSTRRVGNLLQAARVHNMRNVDELVILSVDGLLPAKIVSDICKDTFMPVAIGGGIRCLADAKMLFEHGAEKIIINTYALENPDAITELAAKYGAQSIVVSIDVFDGQVMSNNGRDPWDITPPIWAHRVQSLGAGEILLNDVDRDGTMMGYNIELTASVSEAVRIPVVAVGGCGSYQDMADVLTQTSAHAVAAGALFQFTDATPRGAAEWLGKAGFPVRLT